MKNLEVHSCHNGHDMRMIGAAYDEKDESVVIFDGPGTASAIGWVDLPERRVKWTMCSDKTPDEDGMYLVSVQNPEYDEIITGVTLANWAYGQWWKNSTWVIYAWAKMPEAAMYEAVNFSEKPNG